MSSITIDADKVAELENLASSLGGDTAALASEDLSAAVDVCAVVKKVLPILKTIKSVICAIKFIPGVGAACTALETVISALEAICG
jgi:hypothetical protein